MYLAGMVYENEVMEQYSSHNGSGGGGSTKNTGGSNDQQQGGEQGVGVDHTPALLNKIMWVMTFRI